MGRWKKLAAIAACCCPAAAAASVYIGYSPHHYVVDGWAMVCDGSNLIFSDCKARKALGAADVTIAVSFAIRAEVDTECRRRPRIEGVGHEWPFDDFPFGKVVDRILADVDAARASCGQPPLAEPERRRLWEMVVLLYALRR